MSKRHKHYETIVAWAEGKDVEFLDPSAGKWYSLTGANMVCWSLNNEYRIKPEPDVVKEWRTNKYGECLVSSDANLRLTFDGDTGELKKAEVIE